MVVQKWTLCQACPTFTARLHFLHSWYFSIALMIFMNLKMLKQAWSRSLTQIKFKLMLSTCSFSPKFLHTQAVVSTILSLINGRRFSSHASKASRGIQRNLDENFFIHQLTGSTLCSSVTLSTTNHQLSQQLAMGLGQNKLQAGLGESLYL